MLVLSITLVWCEITMLSSTNLSPLAFPIIALDVNNNPSALQQGFVPLVLCFSYFCTCAFFTLFQFKTAYYSMQPQKQTDTNSLLFNSG